MEVIEARSRAELVVIRQRLHDAWFDVPESGVSPQSGVLTLGGVDDHVVLEQVRTFGPLAELKRGRARTKLVISNVLDVEVIDDARIGNFDLGGLEFEDEWLVISGNVPVEVRCHVAGLEVRAEVSDDLVPAGRSWGLRGSSAGGGT